MSAIAGIYNFGQQSVAKAHLEQMLEILIHRGQDGTGIWYQNNVGLVNRLLWTTPESLLEQLPLEEDRSQLVISADARIDNREELFERLDFDSRETAKITDSELILASYSKWGKDCPKHLLGDFAFAIWDLKEQKLFCARDHFGVRGFNYYCDQEIFVFGTEIKALFCCPEVPRKLNKTRVGDHLTLLLFDDKITYYEDIWRLPPAHSLTIDREGMKIEQYWSLDPEYELKLGSDREYAERLREIFTEAVRCRLRSAYPIGSMLSGGIDSSSISCMARDLLIKDGKQGVHTFTAIFDEVSESDERAYSKSVREQDGIISHLIPGDTSSPLVDIQKVMWHQDQPLFAGNQHLICESYKIAQKENIRVVLEGYDGDQAVSHGVGYLRELAKQGKWLKLTWEMKAFCNNYHYSFQDFWNLWLKYFKGYGLRLFLKRNPFLKHLYLKFKKFLGKDIAASLKKPPSLWKAAINPDFVRDISLTERCQKLKEKRFGSVKNQRREHYNDVTSGLVSHILETMDRNAASYGIELRYPFWDKRLVEFCLSLPTEQKMQNGFTRMIMRRAMEGILPKEIQWRKDKGNLGHSFKHTLLKYEKNTIEEIIEEKSAILANYLDIPAFEQLFRNFQQENYSDDDLLNIWQAVNLALWLEHTKIENPQEETEATQNPA